MNECLVMSMQKKYSVWSIYLKWQPWTILYPRKKFMDIPLEVIIMINFYAVQFSHFGWWWWWCPWRSKQCIICSTIKSAMLLQISYGTYGIGGVDDDNDDDGDFTWSIGVGDIAPFLNSSYYRFSMHFSHLLLHSQKNTKQLTKLVLLC